MISDRYAAVSTQRYPLGVVTSRESMFMLYVVETQTPTHVQKHTTKIRQALRERAQPKIL